MKKSHILVFLLCLLAMVWNTVLAVPAPNRPQKITQPDGSVITLVLHGDEHHSWTTTLDGYSVMKNAKGFFEYVGAIEDGKAVLSGVRASDPEERQNKEKRFLKKISTNLKPAFVSPYGTTSGLTPKGQDPNGNEWQIDPLNFASQKHFKGICVPVNFSDYPLRTSAETIDSLMNMPGYKGYGLPGSVRDYFHDMSQGQFEFSMTVLPPYTALCGREDYGKNATGCSDLKAEVYAYVLRTMGQAVNDYDMDKDGYIDHISIIFAGQGQELNAGQTGLIWSHNGISGGSTSYKQVSISCIAEIDNFENHPGIETYCHEFGHVLGLPDHYDSDYETNGLCEHPGVHDLMSANSASGKPVPLSAFSRYELGWTQLKTLPDNAPGTYTLGDMLQENHALRVNTATPGLFYVLENRSAQNRWQYVDEFGHGLLVFLVDSAWYREKSQYRFIPGPMGYSRYEGNKVNAYADHPGYKLIPANSETYTDNPKTAFYPFGGKYTRLDEAFLSGITEDGSMLSFCYRGEGNSLLALTNRVEYTGERGQYIAYGETVRTSGLDCTERGFCYGVLPTPSVSGNKVTADTSADRFSARIDLSHLAAGAVINVRAYAKAGDGSVVYGTAKRIELQDTAIKVEGLYVARKAANDFVDNVFNRLSNYGLPSYSGALGYWTEYEKFWGLKTLDLSALDSPILEVYGWGDLGLSSSEDNYSYRSLVTPSIYCSPDNGETWKQIEPLRYGKSKVFVYSLPAPSSTYKIALGGNNSNKCDSVVIRNGMAYTLSPVNTVCRATSAEQDRLYYKRYSSYVDAGDTIFSFNTAGMEKPVVRVRGGNILGKTSNELFYHALQDINPGYEGCDDFHYTHNNPTSVIRYANGFEDNEADLTDAIVLRIAATEPENTERDATTYNTGSYSFKLTGDTMTIQGIPLKATGRYDIAFYARSARTGYGASNLSVSGHTDNEVIQHEVLVTEKWTQTSLPRTRLTGSSLSISFCTPGNEIIYIDDIVVKLSSDTIYTNGFENDEADLMSDVVIRPKTVDPGNTEPDTTGRDATAYQTGSYSFKLSSPLRGQNTMTIQGIPVKSGPRYTVSFYAKSSVSGDHRTSVAFRTDKGEERQETYSVGEEWQQKSFSDLRFEGSSLSIVFSSSDASIFIDDIVVEEIYREETESYGMPVEFVAPLPKESLVHLAVTGYLELEVADMGGGVEILPYSVQAIDNRTVEIGGLFLALSPNTPPILENESGICWSTEPSPSLANHRAVNPAAYAFVLPLTDLPAETLYFYGYTKRGGQVSYSSRHLVSEVKDGQRLETLTFDTLNPVSVIDRTNNSYTLRVYHQQALDGIAAQGICWDRKSSTLPELNAEYTRSIYKESDFRQVQYYTLYSSERNWRNAVIRPFVIDAAGQIAYSPTNYVEACSDNDGDPAYLPGKVIKAPCDLIADLLTTDGPKYWKTTIGSSVEANSYNTSARFGNRYTSYPSPDTSCFHSPIIDQSDCGNPRLFMRVSSADRAASRFSVYAINARSGQKSLLQDVRLQKTRDDAYSPVLIPTRQEGDSIYIAFEFPTASVNISFSEFRIEDVATATACTDSLYEQEGRVTMKGHVSAVGNISPVTASGFVYSTYGDPVRDGDMAYFADSVHVQADASGRFSASFPQKLMAYVYCRAFATNANGTAYGDLMQILACGDYIVSANALPVTDNRQTTLYGSDGNTCAVSACHNQSSGILELKHRPANNKILATGSFYVDIPTYISDENGLPLNVYKENDVELYREKFEQLVHNTYQLFYRTENNQEWTIMQENSYSMRFTRSQWLLNATYSTASFSFEFHAPRDLAQFMLMTERWENAGLGGITYTESSQTDLTASTPSIGYVTVQDNKNMLHWSIPDWNNVSRMVIYREGNTAGSLEALQEITPNSGTARSGSFTDQTSLPSTKAYTYVLKSFNSEGLDFASTPHKTMHLTINKGIQNQWNLLWNFYEGREVSSVSVYRGNSEGTLTFIDEIAGTNNTYTDVNAPEGDVYYVVEVKFDDAKNAKAATVSRSNIATNVTQATTYTVSIQQTTGGNVSVTYNGQPISSGTVLEEGSVLKLTATPNNGYLFEKWMDGSTVNPRNLTLSGNLSVSATFKKNGVGIEEAEADNIQVYPNPMDDRLHIVSPYGIHVAELYNLQGLVVWKKQNFIQTELNTKDLPAGVYFLRCQTDHGIVTVKTVKR